MSRTSLSPAAGPAGGLPEYRLSSDLAVYCLPSANRDESRKLAWANSVCLLFLGVAVLGIRQPVFVIREVEPLPEPMPVVILPPPVESEPQPQQVKEEPEEVEVPEDELEIPVVAPVMVAAAQDANFSVPVEGFTALASDVRFVPPPPAIIPKAPPPDALPKADFRNIRFGGKEFRKQPPPGYPDEFSRNRIGGTVEALITVATNGLISKVAVGRSSGFPALDRHVTEFIRKEWKAEPGPEEARYRIAITFAP